MIIPSVAPLASLDSVAFRLEILGLRDKLEANNSVTPEDSLLALLFNFFNILCELRVSKVLASLGGNGELRVSKVFASLGGNLGF